MLCWWCRTLPSCKHDCMQGHFPGEEDPQLMRHHQVSRKLKRKSHQAGIPKTQQQHFSGARLEVRVGCSPVLDCIFSSPFWILLCFSQTEPISSPQMSYTPSSPWACTGYSVQLGPPSLFLYFYSSSLMLSFSPKIIPLPESAFLITANAALTMACLHLWDLPNLRLPEGGCRGLCVTVSFVPSQYLAHGRCLKKCYPC